MTEIKFKKKILEMGVSQEEVAKVDFAKIKDIIDGAKSIEGLCKAVKDVYPDFNESEFKNAIIENAKESEEAQDLSDDALEAVAGGSLGSWLKKNKKEILYTAVGVGAFGALIYGGGKLINSGASSSNRSSLSSSQVDKEVSHLDNFLFD